jgi:hypothetical protein
VTCLVIADWDDPDVLALRNGGVEMLWLALGRPAEHYELFFDGREGRIGDGVVIVDSALARRADRVVYRRWQVSPPSVPVSVSTFEDPAVRAFAEREWSAALEVLLHSWYQAAPEKWSRSPLLHANKQVLLYQLDQVVPVPAFTIGNATVAPAWQCVSKTIATDQHFGTGLHASTIRVQPEDFNGSRQACPTLVQTMVEPDVELRISFSFGHVAAVTQRPASGSPVDVRFASEVEREPVELLGLAETATAVARALSLGVFTADVIVDRQGMQWWVDINPDGLHIAADDADGTLLSALIHGLA